MRDEAGRLVVKARVAAAPAEGAANEAVAALLAKALGRPKRDVRLVTGAAARVKQFEIDGIEAAEIEAALARVGAPRA